MDYPNRLSQWIIPMDYPNSSDQTAMIIACEEKNEEIVYKLLGVQNINYDS